MRAELLQLLGLMTEHGLRRCEHCEHLPVFTVNEPFAATSEPMIRALGRLAEASVMLIILLGVVGYLSVQRLWLRWFSRGD